jgi:hypothetical protein
MDQLSLENFENSRVRAFVLSKYSKCLLLSKFGLLWGECLIMGKRGSFVLSKYSKCLLLSKVGLLWGECLIMGKRGSFWIFDQFLWEYLSLCLNKCVWLRDRILSLICKNKPSGGKGWSKYAKFEWKTILVQNWINVALLLVAFCCVGINHQKGGRLKGKCALGHFLSILEIKCPTQMV